MLSRGLSSTIGLQTIKQESVQCEEDCLCNQVALCMGLSLYQQAFNSLYISFCSSICLLVIRTGCYVFDVTVFQELSKLSTSKLSSVVRDHFI